MANTAKSLLDRLLTVEVDLIVTENLSTRPALDGPDDFDAAVGALVADYTRWIVERSAALDVDWEALVSSLAPDAARLVVWGRVGLVENGRPVGGLDVGRLADSPASRSPADLPEIERVAQLAVEMCTALIASGRLSDPHVATVFHRITGNAAQLRQLSSSSWPSSDQLALARKAIELSTDVILTQTVVQADGDVVVRIDPTIVSSEMRTAADAADAVVNQTLAYWRSLIDLIGVVATTAATPTGTHWQLGTLRRLGFRRWWAGRSTESATATEERLGPRRTWTLLRTTGADLFSRGGAAIESPANSGAPYARTVIQADGDALWFVRHDALADRGLLDQHMTRVRDWYESTGSAIAGARAYTVRLQRTASVCLGIVATASTLAPFGWWSLVVGTGAALVAPRLVRSGVGRVFRRRCRIGAW